MTGEGQTSSPEDSNAKALKEEEDRLRQELADLVRPESVRLLKQQIEEARRGTFVSDESAGRCCLKTIRAEELAHANTKAQLEAMTKARDAETAKLNDMTKARDAETTKLNDMTKARDAETTKLNDMTKARDAETTKLNDMTKARDAEMAKLDVMTKARDAKTAKLNDMTKARDAEMAKLDVMTKARNAETAKLNDMTKARNAETAKLDAMVKARDAETAKLEKEESAHRATKQQLSEETEKVRTLNARQPRTVTLYMFNPERLPGTGEFKKEYPQTKKISGQDVTMLDENYKLDSKGRVLPIRQPR
jgi:hypothetical protein